MERNCQKRSKPPITNSVIARLMCLDERSHHQPLHIHQRVLSKSYIHKTATVGLRQGWSVYTERSRNTNNEIFQGSSGVQICKSKNLYTLEKHPHLGSNPVEMVIGCRKGQQASVSNPAFGVSYEDRKSACKNVEYHAPEYALRYLQKLDNDLYDLGIGYTNKFLNFQSKKIDSPHFSSTAISVFKSKSAEVTTNKFGDEALDLPSRSENGNSFRSKSGEHYCKLAYHLQLDNDIVSNSVTAHHRTTSRMYRKHMFRCNSKDSSMPPNNGVSYLSDPGVLLPSFSGIYDNKNYNSAPHLLLDQSSFREKKFETFQRGKEMQNVEVSVLSQSHSDMGALAEIGLMQKYMHKRLGRNDLWMQSSETSRNTVSSSPSVIGPIKFRENDHLRNLQVSESKAIHGTVLHVETRKENRKSHKEEISLREIEEPRCDSTCEKFYSPELDCTIAQSIKIVDESSCCFSCTGLEKDSPVYDSKVSDEIANSSENYTIIHIEFGQKILQNSIDDKLTDAVTFNRGVSSIICEDQLSESNPSATEVFSSEASINEFSEEKIGYSNYSRGPPEFQKYLKGINCSPNSVLEPFDFPNSSAIKCFETTDQQLPLQVFSPTSEETRSHASGMGISGDEEETKEWIGDVSINSLMVNEWLREDESRNFSYLADVLDEAGFFREKLAMDIESWHCLDCPISPLVFEVLEKKYGRQTSWQKSDRLLLFELINSGLIRIVNQIVNFHASSASMRRFISLKRDDVEDKLWMMLIIQGKEKSRDMSEKAVEDAMKWIEVDEEINIISREIEASLFDELVIESISLWNL